MSLSLKRVDRPRDLKWFQAGAMLYGDWGTSKAYVLGIAFALTGHGSWLLLGLMSLLTGVVGRCYMTICRVYPDGGGVYSSVKNRSQLLAVVGALLLIADYVVTASLSALDAFHYFNFPNPELWAIGAILLIGAINWLGPTKMGSIACVIALAASVTAGILFISTLPSLPHVQLTWPEGGLFKNWTTFVGIVLALSGVEAIANMTGIMQEPVERTSKRAIWPVLMEVSLLTFLLGIAMNAIPGLTGHTEDMLRALANHYIGNWYGVLISIVFGFLLLSAVNTAITDLVSVQFLLAKDKELPQVFCHLNRFGMPALALIVATLIPALVLIIEHNLVRLAALYAIGVVGAVTINLGACATNKKLSMSSNERLLLSISACILFFVEITIAFQKHNALIFAFSIMGGGLALRQIAKMVSPIRVPEFIPASAVLSVTEAREIASLYRGSSLVALRSINPYLLEEAVRRTKSLGETSLYVNFVEEAPAASKLPAEMEPSQEALELLTHAQKEVEKLGVTAIPIWQYGDDPGKMISYAAKELGINTIMIGTTKRSAMINLIRGSVFRSLARHLPPSCHLIISG